MKKKPIVNSKKESRLAKKIKGLLKQADALEKDAELYNKTGKSKIAQKELRNFFNMKNFLREKE